MPYAVDHKKRTREKILQSAHRLFSTKGFEAASIEEIMLDCNLTRGGFYAHFRSKAQLYQEAMGSTAAWRKSPESAAEKPYDHWLDAMLASCLSASDKAEHGGHRWRFLITDVASKQPEVRAAYTDAFKAMSERLCREMDRSSGSDKSALAAMAMIVGALTVAITVDDVALKTSLIDACRQHAQALFENRDKDDRLSFFWTAEANESARGPLGGRAMH